MNPAISVIVPIYNVEKYLSKCIESIINQTLANIEIILVNDGSTDNSGKIADEYSNLDNRIRVIHQQNSGQGSARNKGIEISNGKYIGFVDADDWIDADMYEKMYEKAINRNADIICCSRKVFDEEYNLKLIVDVKEVEYDSVKSDLPNYVINDLLYPQTVSTCNKIYLSKVIKRNDIKFRSVKEVGSEDTLFNYCTLLHANKIITEKNTFYNGVERRGSTTRFYKFGCMERTGNLVKSIYEYSKEKHCEEIGEIIAPIMLLFFQQWNYNYIKTYAKEEFLNKFYEEQKSIENDFYFKRAERMLIFNKKLQPFIKKMGYGYKGRLFMKCYLLLCLIKMNKLAVKVRAIL